MEVRLQCDRERWERKWGRGKSRECEESQRGSGRGGWWDVQVLAL